MKCLICSHHSSPLFEGVITLKHQVQYYQCGNCGFIQTEKPYWLDEAYKKAITSTDIGLLSRNIYLADVVLKLVVEHFDSKKKFLDFGGGYGILVRLLRDHGLDFYRQDIYCENLFAQGHDITDLDEHDYHFELVTCSEVFEHIDGPAKLMEQLLGYADNILVTTLLVPENTYQSTDDWWYFSPETGQHISFYTKHALEILAKEFGLNLYSNGSDLHLFSRKQLTVNPLLVKRSWKEKLIYKLNYLFIDQHKNKLKSLIASDLAIAKQKANSNK